MPHTNVAITPPLTVSVSPPIFKHGHSTQSHARSSRNLNYHMHDVQSFLPLRIRLHRNHTKVQLGTFFWPGFPETVHGFSVQWSGDAIVMCLVALRGVGIGFSAAFGPGAVEVAAVLGILRPARRSSSAHAFFVRSSTLLANDFTVSIDEDARKKQNRVMHSI